MKLSKLQQLTEKERINIILKFQKTYKTKDEREKIFNEMSNADINFLIYCLDNIHAKIAYSKYLKEE